MLARAMKPFSPLAAILKSIRRYLVPLVGIALFCLLVISGAVFQVLIIKSIGIDIWSNLAASAISFPIETAIIYLVINVVLAKREEDRVNPTRAIVASKLILVHRMIFQGTAVAFRPPSEFQLNGHYSGPKAGEPTAIFELRKSGFGGWREHLTELREIIDLSSVALGGDWLPNVFAHYTAAKRATSSISFLFNSFDPNNIGKKEFIGAFPEDQLRTMESAYRWVMLQFPHLSGIRGDVPVKTADELLRMLQSTAKEWPHMSGTPETYRPNSKSVIPVIENADVLRRINPKGLADGQQVYLATLNS
jgi:hypothetical protein